MFQRMNLPNKLTIFRMVLVPIFIILLAVANVALTVDATENATVISILTWIALAIYIIASLTDTLDGYLSRKNNLVTKFGKIMDPLADKLLVSAGFIMLTGVGCMPAVITAVVVFRDFFVNALRMFGSDNGKDVSAGISGKVKTVLQMLTVVFGLIGFAIDSDFAFFEFLGTGTYELSTLEIFANVGFTVFGISTLIVTIWSFVEYFIRFKDDINVEE